MGKSEKVVLDFLIHYHRLCPSLLCYKSKRRQERQEQAEAEARRLREASGSERSMGPAAIQRV